MAFAVFKGLTRGLVVGVFSFLAYFIGLAAALKFSSGIAKYISGKGQEPSLWLPVVAFLAILIIVILIVNLLARLIRSAMKTATLGWFDKVGGVVFFLMVNIFIFSILLFYASGAGWIGESTKNNSKVFPYVISVAPAMTDFLGKLFPVFSDLFKDLGTFFERLNAKI